MLVFSGGGRQAWQLKSTILGNFNVRGVSPSEVSALVNPDVLAKVLFNVFAKFSVRVRGQEVAVLLEFVMGVFFPRRWQKGRLTKVRPGFMFLVA